MNLVVSEASYRDKNQIEAIKMLANAYAEDVMGGGESLTDEELKNMIEGLKKSGNALTFLAYVDGAPIGIANCFVGFSTFEACSILNIHDFAVLPGYRRRGVGKALLEAIQKKARKIKCCRLTLEVRSDNMAAQQLYKQFGFEKGSPPMWFMTKEFY